MKEILVTALATGMDAARVVSGHLDADLVPYDEDLFGMAFEKYRAIVAVMAAGIVVRRIAPLIRSKWSDPAVVVVSSDLRYAVPVLGGHHGANRLASRLAELGICPVITTATEVAGKEAVEVLGERLGYEVVNPSSTRETNSAILVTRVPVFSLEGPAIVLAGPGVSLLTRKGKYFVGLGCRRGVLKDDVIKAIRAGIHDAGIDGEEVMVYATTVRKSHETGLLRGVQGVGGVLVLLEDEALMDTGAVSPSGAWRIGLPGVAEPCALAVSRYHELVTEKKVYGEVTLAIAR